jgi:hypothetical protein
MARYIDADALRKQMFSYYGCINENTAKENYRGVTLMDYEVADLIEDCIDNAPTADVVPKKEIANVLGDLKIAVHNKAHYNHAKEVPTYITIRELDAILQGFIEKWRVK